MIGRPTTLYKLTWNETKTQWRGKAKLISENGSEVWHDFWLPRDITKHQEIEAERWLLGRMASYKPSESVQDKVEPAKLTIALLAGKWLDSCYERDDLTRGTYEGYKKSMNNWILDNPKFPHFSIQNIDIEKDFTPEVVIKWIDSLKGAPATKKHLINDLRSFFTDCLKKGLLPHTVINPIKLDRVKGELLSREKQAKKQATRRKEKIKDDVIIIQPFQIGAIFACDSVPLIRKMRYLFALLTGARANEIQGMIWSDIDFSTSSLSIWRQLEKPGVLPMVDIDELTENGVEKDKLFDRPNAVVAVPKLNSARNLPLHPLLSSALTWWKEIGYQQYCGLTPADNMPVFPHGKTGRGVAGKSVGAFTSPESAKELRIDIEIATKVASPAKGLRPTFHAWRRTFTTLLERGGVGAEVRQQLLGHHEHQTVERKHYLGERERETLMIELGKMPLPNEVSAFVQGLQAQSKA